MAKKVVSKFIITILLLVSFIPVFSSVSYADTTIPQAGANPIVFNQTATTDNLIYLMAAGSEHNSSLSVDNYGAPKHTFISNFFGRTTDYMIWTVNLPAAAVYHVDMLVSNNENTPLKLSVVGTSTVLNFSTNNIGWDKLDAGTISLPAGTSQIKLEGNTGTAKSMKIKSLELIRNSDYAAYQSRIASFKKDTTWLSNAGYGLMFQYGGWGYPQSGAKKSLDAQAADFNVTNFVNMVKNTGATYVIWSASWWTYELNAPITQVDTIVGNGNRTSSRDLIGDVASALHAVGIKFMLYYHSGQDSHMGYNSTDFWQAQNWPSQFTTTGTGDRSTFFNNWTNIITAMGNRYGTNLDGWIFDDGSMMYYPGPFEQLGAAARAGNANRLISYNPWETARITDFQDFYFGEASHGEVQTGSAPVGGNGVFTSGPHKGLLQQAMFTMEQDWGVHAANMPINTQISSFSAIPWVQSAKQRRVPLSFNMMMWEDGTVSASSLQVLTDVKNATTLVNNLDPNIAYTGAWSLDSNRGLGDYQDDVKYTTTNNDSFEYTFSGTGVNYITEKNSDQGNVDIYIDNVFQQTVSCYNATRLMQQTVYSKTGLTNGTHTIKGVKTSGQYMLVDAFSVASGPVYNKIKNRSDSKVLNGGGGTNGSAVTEWDDVTSTNLQWQIIDLGNGYYKIINRTNGRVLNGGGGTDGYAVTEWEDGTSTNLQWQIIDLGNGYYKIKNRTDGKVLNGGGGTNGYAVTEWSDVTSSNLEWQIIEN